MIYQVYTLVYFEKGSVDSLSTPLKMFNKLNKNFNN